MSDNFLSAEKPKSETDSGWIEYALLLGWEELPVGYEYVTDNATDELTTLRAQLAEAQKYPELRCNHCDKVLTATWIDDALGRFALIDKCYCG